MGHASNIFSTHKTPKNIIHEGVDLAILLLPPPPPPPPQEDDPQEDNFLTGKRKPVSRQRPPTDTFISCFHEQSGSKNGLVLVIPRALWEFWSALRCSSCLLLKAILSRGSFFFCYRDHRGPCKGFLLLLPYIKQDKSHTL